MISMVSIFRCEAALDELLQGIGYLGWFGSL